MRPEGHTTGTSAKGRLGPLPKSPCIPTDHGREEVALSRGGGGGGHGDGDVWKPFARPPPGQATLGHASTRAWRVLVASSGPWGLWRGATAAFAVDGRSNQTTGPNPDHVASRWPPLDWSGPCHMTTGADAMHTPGDDRAVMDWSHFTPSHSEAWTLPKHP